MRNARTLLVIAVAAASVVAASFQPQFNSERVYVHCPGQSTTTKAHLPNEPVTWNRTKPSASIEEGAGCGTADVGEFFQDLEPTGQTGITYKGTHHGNLDRLTVHAWVIGPAATAAQTLIVDFELRVDGKRVLAGPNVTVPAAPSETMASSELVFSITDIGLTRKADLKKHNVELELGISSPASGAVAFVLDTTEVPSGIHFSPNKLAPTRFSADS